MRTNGVRAEPVLPVSLEEPIIHRDFLVMHPDEAVAEHTTLISVHHTDVSDSIPELVSLLTFGSQGAAIGVEALKFVDRIAHASASTVLGTAMNSVTSPAAFERQKPTPPASSSQAPPLVVDLDGTLVRTDMLIESIFSLLRQQPLFLFALPYLLLKGRAHLKHEVARRVKLDASLLPYRSDVLEHLRGEHETGRTIVLATASDERLAQSVADHLQVFDFIFASDGSTNLAGQCKRERLVTQFGERGFDYAANGRSDLAVWSSARKAIVVSSNQHLLRAVVKVAEVQTVFEDCRTTLAEYLSALRPQHWLKNLLVFVPVLVAHRFFEPVLLGNSLLAFMAFCCCASSGYLLNDLFDLSADRQHPNKRLRPLASGRVPLAYTFAMVPALVVLGCVLAALVSKLLVGALFLYFTLTLIYSLYIKEVVLLDVIVLASLYTFRIIVGAVAVAIRPSEWLLAFSPFFFLSLALVKRYGELVVMRRIDGDHAKARNYKIIDAELLAINGTASGYVAASVLALYIMSGAVTTFWVRHEFMWFLCPLLLYWVNHVWLTAHRGRMHDDPLVFALRDRTSRVLILLMAGTALLTS